MLMILIYSGIIVDATKKSTDALIGANKDVPLEVNTKKTKYTSLMPHRQTAGQIHNIERVNRSVEYTVKIKCLGKTLLNQNCIHE